MSTDRRAITPSSCSRRTSATRDSRSRTIYVKLVNPGDTPAPVQLEITGATLGATATALTLAADAQATNAIDAPERVVPIPSQIPDVKRGMTYTVPANGIVVLALQPR